MRYFQVLIKSVFIPLIFFIISISITIGLSLYTSYNNKYLANKNILNDSQTITNRIINQLNLYISALYGIRGLYEASQSVERKEFYAFINSEQIFKRFPGLFSTSYVQKITQSEKQKFIDEVKNDKSLNPKGYPDFKIFPERQAQEYYIVKYVEPFTGREKIFGLDYLGDPIRRKMSEDARDTGLPQISDTLTSLNTGEKILVVMLPIYKKDAKLTTIEERRQALEGFAVSSILIKDLFNELFKNNLNYSYISWQLEVAPLNEDKKNNLIYQEGQIFSGQAKRTNVISYTNFFKLTGRDWFLTVYDANGGLTDIENKIPSMILLLGTIFSLMVFGVIYLINSNQLRAEHLAQKMTAAYRENEDKFQAISAASGDAIIIIDSKDNIVFWNKAAERMFQYSQNEVLNNKLHNIIAFDIDVNKYRQDLHNFGETGESMLLNKVLQLTVQRKNGEKFPIELNISSIKINNIWHAVGIARDISERKKIEEEKAKQMIELERMNNIMVNRELKMLELKNKLKETEKKDD